MHCEVNWLKQDWQPLNMERVSFLPGVVVGNMMVFHLPISRDGETSVYKNYTIPIEQEFGTACANVKIN